MFFECSFNRAHPAPVLLQFCFRVPIGFIKGLDGIFEVMKLTELMWHTWKHKGHSASNGFLAVRDDAFDRDLERLQKLLDFLQQCSDIPLGTAVQWPSQQHFL